MVLLKIMTIRRGLVFKKTSSILFAIILGVAFFLPGSNVSALGSCENPEADSVIWYKGNSVTRAGTLEPGQSYYGEIEACNSDIVARKVKMSTAPYSINQADYENVDFMTSNDWNRLADWISFPDGDTYTIESGQTVYLKFRIQVPSDGSAIGGTQSASLMLTDVFREEGSENVGLQTEARYLWQVTADINSSDLRREGKITSWWADGILVFDNSNGLKTKSIIENTGNVSFMADYHVTFYDVFRNNAIAYEADAEKEILPESSRANEFKWNEAPAVGWFKVVEEITVYGKTETFEKTIFVVPLWFIVIVVAIIILLIWALILRIKQRHDKNKKLKS